MEVSVFIENIQKAFGEKVQLPFAFWYSDERINDDLKKINGCFFKEFERLIGGEPISLSADRRSHRLLLQSYCRQNRVYGR